MNASPKDIQYWQDLANRICTKENIPKIEVTLVPKHHRLKVNNINLSAFYWNPYTKISLHIELDLTSNYDVDYFILCHELGHWADYWKNPLQEPIHSQEELSRRETAANMFALSQGALPCINGWEFVNNALHLTKTSLFKRIKARRFYVEHTPTATPEPILKSILAVL